MIMTHFLVQAVPVRSFSAFIIVYSDWSFFANCLLRMRNTHQLFNVTTSEIAKKIYVFFPLLLNGTDKKYSSI